MAGNQKLPSLLCCPTPTATVSQTACCPPMGPSLHPRPIPVTPPDECADAKPVKICGPIEIIPTEPACQPISIPYEKCDGTMGTAVGTTCEMIQVVPHPESVMKVKICGGADYEKQIFCDPVTGNKVAIITDFSNGPTNPITTYWDLIAAAPWTGDPATLENCPDTDLESDPREVCVDGVTLTQWVVKSNGEPTGTVYYTDIKGQLVPVASTATITIGACKECECVQSISDATGDDLSTLLPGTTFSFTKPECCVVRVTTDIGSFTIRKGVTTFVSQEFRCPFEVTAVEIVSGDCTLDEVHIISNSSVEVCA